MEHWRTRCSERLQQLGVVRDYEIKLEDVEASHTLDGALAVAKAQVIAVPEAAHSEYMASLQDGAALKTSKDELQDASKYASDIIRGHKTSMSSRASKIDARSRDADVKSSMQISSRASMPSELGGLHDEMELVATRETRPPVIVPHDSSSEESRRLYALLRHKQACEHQLLQKRADQEEKQKSNGGVNGGVRKPQLAFEQQLLDQRLAKNNMLKEVHAERGRPKEGLRTTDELLEDVCAFFKAELLSQKQSYEKKLLDTRQANEKILKEVQEQHICLKEELLNDVRLLLHPASPHDHRASEPENISAQMGKAPSEPGTPESSASKPENITYPSAAEPGRPGSSASEPEDLTSPRAAPTTRNRKSPVKQGKKDQDAYNVLSLNQIDVMTPAVIKIQSLYRGWSVRKYVGYLRQQKLSQQDEHFWLAKCYTAIKRFFSSTKWRDNPHHTRSGEHKKAVWNHKRHQQDWIHVHMAKLNMIPDEAPETIVEDLDYNLSLPASVYTSVWLTPLIDGRLWYGRPRDDPEKVMRAAYSLFVEEFQDNTDQYETLYGKEAAAERENRRYMEWQNADQWKWKYKALEFKCLACGHKFILGRHAGHGNLQRSLSSMSVSSAPCPACCPKCECNKIDAHLKDDTLKLFGDWDIPNILGLEPPKMIISLIGPNLVLFSIVLTIQYCYIFYIQEVVGHKMETHEIQGYIMCYGETEHKEEWDTQEPKVLRVVCLLTFLTEFFRELNEVGDYIMWIGQVPRWQPHHGYKWKYQNYKSKDYEIVHIGDSLMPVTLKARKPFTGITDHYRFFIAFVIFNKAVIAVVLAVYATAWIMSEENAGDLILNTLAACFIFEVDDIVYQGFTMEVGKSICDPEKHKIQYCRREKPMRLSSTPRLLAFWTKVACYALWFWALTRLWCRSFGF